jgi:uncharacterized protein YdaU (DUF1376 family)
MPRYFLNLNIGDFLRDTQNLSAQNLGAYVALLMHYTARGQLPITDAELRQIARMSAQQWRRNKPILQKFFDPQWRQARVETDLSKQDRLSILRKVAGQEGGRAKAANKRARSRFRN